MKYGDHQTHKNEGQRSGKSSQYPTLTLTCFSHKPSKDHIKYFQYAR